ncbi:MAG: hypothetical protein M1530_00705 [Candidatus Marsarchaeota archaeon]|nr:hypothetical protein [Candidatus Marsarchaeota archaeon]
MAFDLVLIGGIAASILFLALLVWLMARAASDARWPELSRGAREARARQEREHGA